MSYAATRPGGSSSPGLGMLCPTRESSRRQHNPTMKSNSQDGELPAHIRFSRSALFQSLKASEVKTNVVAWKSSVAAYLGTVLARCVCNQMRIDMHTYIHIIYICIYRERERDLGNYSYKTGYSKPEPSI